MAEIEEESLLRIATFGHQRRSQNLFTEFQIRIPLQNLVDISQEALRINDILLEIRKENAESSEQFIGRQPGHRERDEFGIFLYGLQRLSCNVIAQAMGRASLDVRDDTMVVQLLNGRAETDKLYVGTTDIVGQVIIVAPACGAMLYDVAQQDGSFLGNPQLG